MYKLINDETLNSSKLRKNLYQSSLLPVVFISSDLVFFSKLLILVVYTNKTSG